MAVKEITDAFNEGRAERQKVTPQRIGKRLKALGFHTGRTGSGAAAIDYDVSKIEILKASYGLKGTSDTSDSSDIP